MRIATLLAALAISVSPAVALAACTGHAKDDTAMSCAEGTTFDAEAGRCVPQTTS